MLCRWGKSLALHSTVNIFHTDYGRADLSSQFTWESVTKRNRQHLSLRSKSDLELVVTWTLQAVARGYDSISFEHPVTTQHIRSDIGAHEHMYHAQKFTQCIQKHFLEQGAIIRHWVLLECGLSQGRCYHVPARATVWVSPYPSKSYSLGFPVF